MANFFLNFQIRYPQYEYYFENLFIVSGILFVFYFVYNYIRRDIQNLYIKKDLHSGFEENESKSKVS